MSDKSPWAPPDSDAFEPYASPRPAAGNRRQAPATKRLLPTVALVLGLTVGFGAVVALVSRIGSNTSSTPPAGTPPLPTLPPLTTAPSAPDTTAAAPPTPVDPAASVLSGLVVRQADVASTASVQPLPGGGDVAGQPTLDLCNGTFPSEALRTARLQVAETDATGNEVLSTEAVLYSTSTATAQAFRELRATAARCPATPVDSPVGEPTVTTHFNPPPDSTWANTATVDRVAFDFVVTDQSSQVRHSTALYLRRGRVLLGVYFSHPDGSQPAANGQSSVAAIVKTFSSRLAALPSSVANSS